MNHDKPGVLYTRMGDFDAPNKAAIGICTLGLIRVEHEIMMSGVGLPMGQALGRIYVKGYGIQDARNIAWNAAEGMGYEYFMFWDDDCVPLSSGAVETMLETMEQNPKIDILGGVYPARQSIPAPIVTLESSGKPWWGWEDGGVHKVWMTGTGFTMYRVSSIQKLDAPVKTFETGKGPWDIPQYFRLENGTDDFALAVEVEKAGLSWYVHGAIVCDQIEPTGLRFQVKNARHRIGGKNEDQNPSRDDDREQPVHEPGTGQPPTFKYGDIVEVGRELAQLLVGNGKAEYYSGPPVIEPAPYEEGAESDVEEPGVVETASVEAEETAEAPRARRGR